MSATDRDYMRRPDPEIDINDIEGVEARNQQEAERLLKFACPTRAANGKWYRVTLAVTNVPVCELYNVLSNMNLIAQHLKEIAAGCHDQAVAAAILRQEACIRSLHGMVKGRDLVGSSPIMMG